MTWFERNGHWALLALVAVTTAAAVGTVAASSLALLAALLSGATLATLLADAAAAVALVAALVAADLVFAVALVVTVVRRASLPRSDRLASAFALLERLFPPLRGIAFSRRFEPTVEDRERALKRRYVDGELSERSFERELRALLADADGSPSRRAPAEAGTRREAGPGAERRTGIRNREVERE